MVIIKQTKNELDLINSRQKSVNEQIDRYTWIYFDTHTLSPVQLQHVKELYNMAICFNSPFAAEVKELIQKCSV